MIVAAPRSGISYSFCITFVGHVPPGCIETVPKLLYLPFSMLLLTCGLLFTRNSFFQSQSNPGFGLYNGERFIFLLHLRGSWSLRWKRRKISRIISILYFIKSGFNLFKIKSITSQWFLCFFYQLEKIQIPNSGSQQSPLTSSPDCPSHVHSLQCL